MQEEKLKVASIVAVCLGQKINFDPLVCDDTGREWWYVSNLFGEFNPSRAEIPEFTIEALAELIKSLNLKTIKAVEVFKMFDRKIIQIRGNREDIIKECNQYK